MRTWKRDEDVTLYEYERYQVKNCPVSEMFEISGGNSGLTEEYLYSLLFNEGDKRYRLLTGSTDLNTTIMIHRCQHPKNADRKINVISGEGIHIVRKGKAGHINYLQCGDYTMTDDAYVLTKKNGITYQVSLEWVAKTQTEIFREYASNSANATWNKSGFLKYATIDVPSYLEQVKGYYGSGR